MYGFIHCALEDLVVKRFGNDVWQKILRQCGIKMRGGSFLIHRIYSDEMTLKLLKTTTQTLGICMDDCLETFGDHFLTFCIDHGFEQLLRTLGSNLYDFLTNLDNLHDHLSSIYPGMKAPSFRVTCRFDESLLLHYYSERQGLHPIVRGLVKMVALKLFDTEVTIRTLKITQNGVKEHVVLEIRQKDPVPCGGRRKSISPAVFTTNVSNSPSDLPLNAKSFARIFPFHVIFNRGLFLTQMGDGLRRFVAKVQNRRKPLRFDDIFVISRPVVKCQFEAIRNHSNMVFVIRTKETFCVTDSPTNKSKNRLPLKLKGQMMFLQESDSFMFLCSPRVSDFEEMIQIGLYLSDFPLHDQTRDLLIMSYQRKGERELTQKLDETSNHLKVLETKLRDDKRRTENILASIFPSEVAAKLLQDLPVEAKVFDVVTCLFSDIVGFTAICGCDTVFPIDIVRMLNRLYLHFDALSQVHEVYKVETIGDAYVVVAGIPQFVPDHADRVVDMALGMVTVTRHVLSPVDNQPIQVRIGVHTGPVIGGVVGLKMPRYCLFGNTVTIANLMENKGHPGAVSVSEVTMRHLHKAYYLEENSDTSDLPVKSFIVKKLKHDESTESLSVVTTLNTTGGHFKSPTNSPCPSEEASGSGTGSPSVKSLLMSPGTFDTPRSSQSSEDSKAKPRRARPSLVFAFPSPPASFATEDDTTNPRTSSSDDVFEKMPPGRIPSIKITQKTKTSPARTLHKASDDYGTSPPSTSGTCGHCDGATGHRRGIFGLLGWPRKFLSTTESPCTCNDAYNNGKRGFSLDSTLLLQSAVVAKGNRNRRSLPEAAHRACSCHFRKFLGLCKHKVGFSVNS